MWSDNPSAVAVNQVSISHAVQSLLVHAALPLSAVDVCCWSLSGMQLVITGRCIAVLYHSYQLMFAVGLLKWCTPHGTSEKAVQFVVH